MQHWGGIKILNCFDGSDKPSKENIVNRPGSEAALYKLAVNMIPCLNLDCDYDPLVCRTQGLLRMTVSSRSSWNP